MAARLADRLAARLADRLAGLFAALALVVLAASGAAAAGPVELERYVAGFDYDAREDMKTSSRELLGLLERGEAELVDIRFAEEQAAWGLGFGLRIPLNELPARLHELPKDKLIVTACPHDDRANIARLYLLTKGFEATYLSDGMLGLMQLLRGDAARRFVRERDRNAAQTGK